MPTVTQTAYAYLPQRLVSSMLSYFSSKSISLLLF